MLSEDELLGVLNGHKDNSIGFEDSDIGTDQNKALDYYNGEPFGDEVEGQSQVVSKDVAEVVDGIMPDLMRIFASGDTVVFFKPENEDDVEAAAQRTDYINHVFFSDNDGFEIIYEFAKDGLLSKNGLCKVWWDDKEEQIVETFEGLSVIQVGSLEDDDEVEITEQETRPVPVALDPMLAQLFPDGKEYDITIERMQQKGRVRVETFPPEEFMISSRATSLDSATYLNHSVEKTLADLVAEGLVGKKDALDLPGGDTTKNEDRKDARFNEEVASEEPDQGLMRDVQVDEEWVIIDADEDGIPERRHIIRVANDILVNEIVDDHNLVDWTPNKMPHRFWGIASADDVTDIQRINSVLLRQMLDNLYLANNPRKYVNMNRVGDTTIDDMLNSRVGGIIRGDGPMQEVVGEFVTPYVAGAAQSMLEYMEGKKEQRSGNFRLTEGLDANTLNPTATGITKLMNAAQGRKELIARRLGAGLAKIFEKIEKTVIKYQDFERTVRLRDKFTVIDPKHWNSSMDVDIMVGLGTGNKDQHKANLQEIFAIQQQAQSSGYADAQVMREKLFNTFSDMVDTMGLPSAIRYIPGPDSPPGDVQSEAEILSQAEIQKETIRAQQKQEESTQDNKVQILKLQTEAQLKMAELNVEADLKVLEIEAEMFLAGAGSVEKIENADTPNVDTRIGLE